MGTSAPLLTQPSFTGYLSNFSFSPNQAKVPLRLVPVHLHPQWLYPQQCHHNLHPPLLLSKGGGGTRKKTHQRKAQGKTASKARKPKPDTPMGSLGLLRYPTKPVSLAVHIATVSIFTYLQGSPPMNYDQMIRETLSGEMPQAYTTIKTEQQAEENMMGVVRARSRKPAVLPREYGPINWYNAPVDLNGQPFRFPWSSDFIKKVINSCLRISPHVRSDYKFIYIQVPNRYWKETVGYSRARPIGRGKELVNHQLRHLDVANVPKWISVAAQVRDRNLSRRMAPLQYEPAWRPQERMTMSGDMPLPLLNSKPGIRRGNAR